MVDTSSWQWVVNFKSNENGWNEELIQEIFKLDSVISILAMKWPGFECLDKLLWKEEKLVSFMVGSSYMLNCAMGDDRNTIWKHIW